MQVNDWLLHEVATGIQKLLFNRLPGAPAHDAVEGTVYAWGEGLRANRREWDQDRDAPRIRAGFAALLGEAEEWPSAAHLLRAMPSAYGQGKLPPPTTYPHVGDESPAAIEARRRHAASVIAEANRRADAQIRAERRA